MLPLFRNTLYLPINFLSILIEQKYDLAAKSLEFPTTAWVECK